MPFRRTEGLGAAVLRGRLPGRPTTSGYDGGDFARVPVGVRCPESSAVQAILLRVNSEQPHVGVGTPTLGAIIARYEKEEMPGRYSTMTAYRSYLDNHIKPRWAETPLNMFKPMEAERWLKALPLAPTSQRHIKSLMHLMFECANGGNSGRSLHAIPSTLFG